MSEDVLTDRRRDLLGFVARKSGTGPPPTMEEMAEHLDCAVSTVYLDLEALEREGWIDRERGKSRSVQILKDPEEEEW